MTDCPNADRHTPAPQGAVAWFSWANAMHWRGHSQVRCDGCGRYAIWNGVRTPSDPADHASACLTAVGEG